MRRIYIATAAAVFGLMTPLVVVHAQTTTIEKEASEAWAKIKGAWTQTKGAVREQWGKLTDDDIMEIDGRREVLIGKLQMRYGISHEEAERQVNGFESKYK